MTRRDALGLLVSLAFVAGACDSTGARSPAASAASFAPATPAPTLAATPSPTAVAAPSGRIAFRRGVGGNGSQVFIVDVDGSNESQLTHEAGEVDRLVWAPDGSRLYFQSIEMKGCGDTYCYPNHLVSVRPDGTDRVDLGQIGAYGVGVLSPDRRFVAYPAGEGYPDGAGQSFQIAALLVDLLAGTTKSLEIQASSIVWSPDSKRLLAAVPDRILVVDAVSPSTQLRIDDPWVEADSPVGWSADGGSIFYRRCAPSLNKDEAIACMAGPSWKVDLADPNLVPQPNSGPEPGTGALSPDGRWRARFIDADAERGLYLTPAAGGQGTLVARLELDGGAFEHPPSWSGDGAWLAIGIPTGIHVVPAAGGKPLFVTLGDAPAWQPAIHVP